MSTSSDRPRNSAPSAPALTSDRAARAIRRYLEAERAVLEVVDDDVPSHLYDASHAARLELQALILAAGRPGMGGGRLLVAGGYAAVMVAELDDPDRTEGPFVVALADSIAFDPIGPAPDLSPSAN